MSDVIAWQGLCIGDKVKVAGEIIRFAPMLGAREVLTVVRFDPTQTAAFVSDRALIQVVAPATLKIGETVVHGTMGRGVIIAIAGGLAWVRFEDSGYTTVSLDCLRRLFK